MAAPLMVWAVLAGVGMSSALAAPTTERGIGADSPAGTAGAGSGFRAPLAPGTRVVTAFDPPAQPWLSGHRGVDLAVTPPAVVLAPADGTVAFAGMVAGRPVVSVDHPNGVRTTYEPVDPAVDTGQAVAAGTPLGRISRPHPGCPVRLCLHWGARIGEDYLDPMSLLAMSGRPIRLKSLEPGDRVW